MGSLSTAPGGGILEFLFLLIVFFGIILLAYFATRFIARRASGRMKSRYMEILDNIGIGTDSQLLIVKAGGEYFLVAKSQKQLSLLTKLDISPESIRVDAVMPGSFTDSLRAALGGKFSHFDAARLKGADSQITTANPAGEAGQNYQEKDARKHV
jgi:flagellar protein FliO/FliZ